MHDQQNVKFRNQTLHGIPHCAPNLSAVLFCLTQQTRAPRLTKALQNICYTVGGGSSDADDRVNLTPINT